MCAFGSFIVVFTLLPFPAHSQDAGSRGLLEILHSQAGKRWAICIGIDNYDDQKLNKLKKAANDALGLSRVLREKGDFTRVFTFSDVKEDGSDRPFRDAFFPTKQKIERFLDNTARNRDISPDDLVVQSETQETEYSDPFMFLDACREGWITRRWFQLSIGRTLYQAWVYPYRISVLSAVTDLVINKHINTLEGAQEDVFPCFRQTIASPGRLL